MFSLQIDEDQLYSMIKRAVSEVLSEQQINNSSNVEQSKDDLINSQEALTLLGVTYATLHKYKASGKLPSYKIGGKLFYKKSEVLNSMRRVNL